MCWSVVRCHLMGALCRFFDGESSPGNSVCHFLCQPVGVLLPSNLTIDLLNLNHSQIHLDDDISLFRVATRLEYLENSGNSKVVREKSG